MKILKHVSLKLYSTMRLGGFADYAVHISSESELLEALTWAEAKQLPFRVIGGGSNIIWRDEGFAGLLIINDIRGYEEVSVTTTHTIVRVAAGEPWDNAVAISAQHGLHGIELLSLIPGSSGATPVQNVGAYGTDISKTLQSLRAYDTTTKAFVDIAKADCAFGYRTSRFKTSDSGRFVIVSITLKLANQLPHPPFYESLQRYLDEHDIHDYSPQVLRDAVIAVRRSKLPDPKHVANNGSFFANPIVAADHFARIKDEFPDAIGWELPDGSVKVAAGWLVEKSGFRDYHDPSTGMATWPQQSLVLINEHARSTKSLITFRDQIIATVAEYFDITLEQEPELLP